MDAIELTRKLVAIESMLLGELLADHGFEISYHEFAPRRTSVVAQRGANPHHRSLCFPRI